jgi:thioredoxin 2
MAATIVTCPNCGKRNRVRAAAEGVPQCAACGTKLPWLVDADRESFATETTASVPVVVDFWAPWCGPCHMMAPEVEKLAQQTTGNALIVKVDTDAVPELGERFGIRSIPTVAVFKNGQIVARESGARPAADLQALLKRAA